MQKNQKKTRIYQQIEKILKTSYLETKNHMENKKGKLFGIGTGPGNADFLTRSATETIKKCEILIFPNKEKEKCLSFKTIQNLLENADEKELIFLDFPMTKNEKELEESHKKAVEIIAEKLSKGKNAAFLTIGDPTVYSTFFYIKSLIEEKGVESETINGITSFCAAAARLGISLSEKDNQIRIIPNSKGKIDEAEIFTENAEKETLIFMKSGKNLSELKSYLEKKRLEYDFEFYAVSNCSLENEKTAKSLEEFDENSPYMTVAIVKNIKKKSRLFQKKESEEKICGENEKQDGEETGKKARNQASKTPEKNYKFVQNLRCENFPCHKSPEKENFNCLFCFCPLYCLGEKCGGNFFFTEKGIKSCKNCSFPHKKENYDKITGRFKEIAEKMKR